MSFPVLNGCYPNFEPFHPVYLRLRSNRLWPFLIHSAPSRGLSIPITLPEEQPICRSLACIWTPLYNERQYAPNYHVLETIARNDNPEIRGITGMRNYTTQRSRFCKAASALVYLDCIAFDELYLNRYYPLYKIVRTVVLYGGQEERISEIKVGLLLNQNGKLVLGIEAPSLFCRAITNLLDYWN